MSFMRHDSGSLREMVEAAARRDSERGVALFDRRARRPERRTLPEIAAAARLAASRWQALGVQPRDRILTCLPTSWELVDAWLGTVFAGACPVILAPGSAIGSSSAHLRHVEEALGGLTPRFLLCGDGLRRELEARGASSAMLTPAQFDAVAPGSFQDPPAPDPEEPAFLQLTSGSTGSKRAVVISHRALLHNVRASDDAIGAPGGAPVSAWARSMVSWLPLHHDMGLVGTFVFSIACGLELRLMPPDAFLARPEAWMRELADGGPSITAVPSFALGLCAERVRREDIADANFEGWRAAMIGAEMISPHAASAFLEAFTASGIGPSVLRPCYGLAEATLAVTCDRRGEGITTRPLPAGAAREGLAGLAQVASTGVPVLDTRVRIAGPGGGDVAPGQVGEVLVQGPGLFSGYHGATEPALRDGWLPTGDLGFLHEGELYLAGRIKELLVVRGENLMPQEIEWVAEAAAEGGGTCRAAAFSISRDEGEQVVVVVETEAHEPDQVMLLARAVRERVGDELGLPLAEVIVVRRGAIPRTTSGKVRRQALRQQYLENGITSRAGAETGEP